MKLILMGFLLIVLFSILIPVWWWIMIIPFAIYLFWGNRAQSALGGGAVMAVLAWLIPEFYLVISHSKLILHRVSEMIGLQPAGLLFAVSVLIAAVCGGISGLTGSLFKKAIGSAR